MNADTFSPIRWESGRLFLIDQLALPGKETWIECTTPQQVSAAIRDMVVRGAPAIGISAAYGVAIAANELAGERVDAAAFRARLNEVIEMLGATRPTAVNLFWALEQMRTVAESALEGGDVAGAAAAIEARAVAIHADDIAMCKRIGKYGAGLIGDDATVLTHCNAGALATGGYGTALGVIRAAREAGKTLRVLADETRPFLQGSRLTAWELQADGFDVTIIPDSAAAFLLSRGEVSCVIVGADRIAANGDVANKIGTYGVAVAAHRAGVPFYVAAPRSTVDLDTPTGADIPIEERSAAELLRIGDTQLAPANAVARYPAFDVTPAELVTAIITDAGVARAPYDSALRELCRT